MPTSENSAKKRGPHVPPPPPGVNKGGGGDVEFHSCLSLVPGADELLASR